MYRKRNNIMGVLALFAGDYNSKLYLREISRLAKIPLKTTQNAVYLLEKNKILKSKVSGKNKYFMLNLSSIHTKFNLLQSEIHKTMLFLEEYPEFSIFLSGIKTSALMIIFGSFARFTADKNSDVDLLLVNKEKLKLPAHLLPYKIHKIELLEKDFAKAVMQRESLIKEIAENHIILNNHSLYVNVLWDYYENR